MVGLILFETNTFKSIESSFLSDISEKMRNKSKLIKILKNISQMTEKEIKKNWHILHAIVFHSINWQI